FELQRLRGWDGEFHWCSLHKLITATVFVSPKKKEAPPHGESAAPQVGQALLHLALHGGEAPMWLLYQAVRRVRAEQRVRPEHAALIKMVLQSQYEEGTNMSELDMANRDPAYLCGRLLSVLESVQRTALGETNSTVVDRYYGTASSAPATVFGRLMRGARPHLAKLRQEKPGACARLEEALGEVCQGLNTFPPTLSLEKQGLFALGYYHQRASDIAAARAKKAARAASALTSGDDEV
ncbi:MAG: type I-C CRISPR-associated protein Cas8c/Csd1, partial [Ktedonobacterales bacterium]